MTRQKLGQHFLADAGWRERILEQIAPTKEQVWVEIGAGNGEMTRELAIRAGQVLAIEFDRALMEELRKATDGLPVRVVQGDILALDLVELAGPRFCVYGSLPYYITSPILRNLFSIAGNLDEIDVVIQWEVAKRVTAQPRNRDFGWLSVLAQFYTQPEMVLRIPPGAFRPPPKVESALVRMKPPGLDAELKLENEEGFLDFAQHCFAQKRKTLANNLKGLYGAEAVKETLREHGLKLQARAEEMQIREIAAIYRILSGSGRGKT